MAGIFDLVKLYPTKWVETKSRKFTAEECSAVQSCSVVPSKFGRSVCFLFATGKKFIPLEPIADCTVGDVLKVEDLEVVSLKNSSAEAGEPSEILRIRVKKEVPTAVNFDDPFGLG